MTIGHIQNIHTIPPELIDLTPCDLCKVNSALVLFEMNKAFSDDLEVCMFCAERVLQINRMIEYLEN